MWTPHIQKQEIFFYIHTRVNKDYDIGDFIHTEFQSSGLINLHTVKQAISCAGNVLESCKIFTNFLHTNITIFTVEPPITKLSQVQIPEMITLWNFPVFFYSKTHSKRYKFIQWLRSPPQPFEFVAEKYKWKWNVLVLSDTVYQKVWIDLLWPSPIHHENEPAL